MPATKTNATITAEITHRIIRLNIISHLIKSFNLRRFIIENITSHHERFRHLHSLALPSDGKLQKNSGRRLRISQQNSYKPKYLYILAYWNA